MLPSIAVVVLNWNGVEDTLRCLASLHESSLPIHAIVVDNGSTGPDVELIRTSGLADTVIETGSNLGYAAGNNAGLHYALTVAPAFDLVGVLNNDTIVDRECFATLAHHLKDNAHCAIAPTIRYAEEPTRIWFAGGVIDRGWPRHLQPFELADAEEQLRNSQWLTGCCIVASAKTWRQVGLFDTRYFLIFEDCDWSERARRLDVGLLVATDSTIFHRVSSSWATGPPSLLSRFYFIRNGLHFHASHYLRYLPRFAFRHLLRPTVAGVFRPGSGRDLPFFGWLGAIAFIGNQQGAAPRIVRRLAESSTQRDSAVDKRLQRRRSGRP